MKVIGYLCCTDNMPSGSAMKLGDVLTIRNGKTVEILNTDAEGRLVLADGLSLAAEEQPDAIVDIATLTGAVPRRARARRSAGVMGNDQGWVDQVPRRADPDRRAGVAAAARRRVPQAARLRRRRHEEHRRSVRRRDHAALFLNEFVGGVPWAHLDIAGPMNGDADDGIFSKGATGFGVRLFADLLGSSRLALIRSIRPTPAA